MGPGLRRDDVSREWCQPGRHWLWGYAWANIRFRSRGALRPSDASNLCPSNQKRAQGMPGVRWTRGRLCNKKHRRQQPQVHRKHPAFPAQWFYGLYAISPVTGLFCHRHWRRLLRQLDTSVGVSGPHDFAVRLRRSRQQHHPRPPHPAPNVRDDREAPLLWERDGDGYRPIRYF